ncbi:S8 family peptidase [Paremcibacter congregatus]|uniref:S8 family peptidase n=1 Tax=Paremcibacter congregatus TaxID=2043170 RepID=UPI003A8DE2DB
MNMLCTGMKLMIPLVGCISLGACGGSSGSTASPTAVIGTAPPPPAEPVNYDTAEYRHNYGLAQINALTAYEQGATGGGITVAVIDSGVDVDHPQIEANIHPDSTNIVTGNKNDLNDIDGHGTAVAGVIAAVRDPENNASTNVHGVAFDAKVMALNTASVGSCEGDGCSFYDSDIAAALDYARVRGVKVVNISLGGDDFNTQLLVDAYKRAVDAGMLIVIAAGNRDEGDTDADIARPENSASVAWADWANGQIIVAGAVDSSKTISVFSHRAGPVAKDVFLVAAGDSILTLGEGGKYFYYSGTSFATPHIAGAAALLMDAFPNLTGKTAADLLFDTATDLGDATIYGQGLINLQEAFQPQGASSVAVRSAAGTTVVVSPGDSVMLGGAAFGSFAGLSSAVSHSMLLDGYNRSFQLDLGQQIFHDEDPLQLETLVGSRKGARRADLPLNRRSQVTLSWREDSDMREVEERYFSHQNQVQNRYRDLKMKVDMSFDGGQKLTFGQGHSLKETLEDYDGDAFLTIGKGDFMALASGLDSQNVAYKKKLNAKTGLTLALSHKTQDWALYNLKSDSYLAMTRWDHRLSDTVYVGIDLGLMAEEGGVLGSLSGGAISLGDGAATNFLATRLTWKMSDHLTFFSIATLGRTKVQAATFSLIEGVSTVTSQSFSAGLIGQSLFRNGDRLSLAASQPLRVRGGTAKVAQVRERDYATDVLSFATQQVALSPTGREIDIELAYQIGNVWGADLALNVLHQINPNHDSYAPDNSALMIRFGSSF